MRPRGTGALPSLSRIAVVGGGAAGLGAIRQLLAKGVKRECIVAFEARAEVGGLWNYDPVPAACEVSFRSDGTPIARSAREKLDPVALGDAPMYSSLYTNLPKTVMAMRGSPFPSSVPKFPSHQQANEYLHTYALEHKLTPLIRFSTLVRALYHTPNPQDDSQRWTIESSAASASLDAPRQIDLFSHIIIANGHYNQVSIPTIPGLWNWQGEITHSRWWRGPDTFASRNVVVVGSRASGSDIARELAVFDDGNADSTRTIYQSLRNRDEPRGDLYDADLEWAKRIRIVAEIERVDEKKIYLKDGSVIEDVDAIVFATGYLYNFPFCSPMTAPFDTHPLTTPHTASPSSDTVPNSDDAPLGGTRVLNLDPSDIFYAPDPTLSFIGLWYIVNPWPGNEITSRFIAHTYTHGAMISLPPFKRMSEDPLDMRIGVPGEFDNADAMLHAIGEGGDGSTGGWEVVEQSRKEERVIAPQLRKIELGY